MALRKPLVIVNGQVQQLQAGDTLQGPFTEVDQIALSNGESSAITIAKAVYISGSSECKLAKANAGGTKNAFGFVAQASIAAAATGNVQTNGQLDGFVGLTPGSQYYLDPTTAGEITLTPPTTAGQYVVPVGKAVSATVLDIDIDTDVLL